jgi:prepilin-type N-terminal cleavage/methylation domain-containing protein
MNANQIRLSENQDTRVSGYRDIKAVSHPWSPDNLISFYPGFTLAESMVVIVVVSLLVALAAINLKGVLIKNSFKSQAAGLVSALEAASTSAAQTGKRYEVIIDIPPAKLAAA